jgi:hypothetical protein
MNITQRIPNEIDIFVLANLALPLTANPTFDLLLADSANLTQVERPVSVLPFLFPAIMLSGLTALFRTRTSLVILFITAVSSGILLVGNVGGWFGFLSGEPRMWHEGRQTEIAGGKAFVVILTIQNQGQGALKLRLDPVMRPEETSVVLTAQKYSVQDKKWADYSIEQLLSERSKSMFPLEVLPGGSLLLEMIFMQSGRMEESSAPAQNAPGAYSISLSDPVRMRVYRHEIKVGGVFD